MDEVAQAARLVETALVLTLDPPVETLMPVRAAAGGKRYLAAPDEPWYWGGGMMYWTSSVSIL